jgi:predicted small metal-binding protein
MARKYVDCRDYPSQIKCSLRLSGEEEEVIRAAIDHAVSVHGHQNTPEFRAQLRQSLQEEPDTSEEIRPPVSLRSARTISEIDSPAANL